MVSLDDINMTSKVCIIHAREAAKKDKIKNFKGLSSKVCRTKIC